MRLMSSTSWEGIFTAIRNLFHIFMFYILTSTYLYHSRGYFFKNNFFVCVCVCYRSSLSSHIGLHSFTSDPSLQKLWQQKLEIGKKYHSMRVSAVVILLWLILKVSWEHGWKLFFWTTILCSNMNVTKFCRWKWFLTSFEERSCTLPKSTDSISRQEIIITTKRKIEIEDYRLTFLSNQIRKNGFWFKFLR